LVLPWPLAPHIIDMNSSSPPTNNIISPISVGAHDVDGGKPVQEVEREWGVELDRVISYQKSNALDISQ
jgi:hypothetical protein